MGLMNVWIGLVLLVTGVMSADYTMGCGMVHNKDVYDLKGLTRPYDSIQQYS